MRKFEIGDKVRSDVNYRISEVMGYTESGKVIIRRDGWEDKIVEEKVLRKVQ